MTAKKPTPDKQCAVNCHCHCTKDCHCCCRDATIIPACLHCYCIGKQNNNYGITFTYYNSGHYESCCKCGNSIWVANANWFTNTTGTAAPMVSSPSSQPVLYTVTNNTEQVS